MEVSATGKIDKSKPAQEGGAEQGAKPGTSSFVYNNPQHTQQLLKGLDRVRDSREFTDITLRVGDRKFECHKLVLSLATPYFRTMFTSGMKEASAAEVTMQGIEPDIFSKIIDFIYRGKILIEECNFQGLLEAGNMLQLETLCDGCAKYLEKELAAHNCLGFWLFGRRLNNDSLVETALAYARQHFTEVQHEEEFMNLSPTELCQYIREDSLNVKSEDEVGQAVMAWFLRDPDTRTTAMKEVLLHLRLNHLSLEYLRLHMMRCSHLRQNAECMQLVDRAMDMQLFPEARIFELYSNYPRLSMGMEQYLLVFARAFPKYLGQRDSNRVTRYHYYDEYEDSSYRPHGIEGRPMHAVPLQRMPAEATIIGGAAQWLTNERVAACTIRNDVYIAGAGSRCDEIWKYDGQRGDWQKCASLTKLFSPSCVIPLGEKIYVFGGILITDRLDTTRIPLPEFEEYCTRTNRCRVVGQLHLPVQDMGCAAHNSIIYILGGTDSTRSPTSTMQLVHVSKKPPVVELELSLSLPHAPRRLGVIQHEDSLLVVTDQAILGYSVTNKVWQTLSTHGAGNHSFACCLDNHYLYVVGGQLPTSDCPSPPDDEDKKKDEAKKPEEAKAARRLYSLGERYCGDDTDDCYYETDEDEDEEAVVIREELLLARRRQKEILDKGEKPKSSVFRIPVQSILSAPAGAHHSRDCRLVWERYATLPWQTIVHSVCSVARHAVPASKDSADNIPTAKRMRLSYLM